MARELPSYVLPGPAPVPTRYGFKIALSPRPESEDFAEWLADNNLDPARMVARGCVLAYSDQSGDFTLTYRPFEDGAPQPFTSVAVTKPPATVLGEVKSR